jgi:hypothetical protein
MYRFIIVLFICSLGFSEDIKPPTGFHGIPFGVSKDTFGLKWNELCSKDSDQNLRDAIKYEDYENFYYVANYPLGNQTYRLTFRFNKNGRFYKYEFHSPDYPANYFETTVKSHVDYLSKVFQKKFGDPKKKYNPGLSDIKAGQVSYCWKWRFKKQTVYTGISIYESDYYATAAVSDNDLEDEHNQPLKQDNKTSIDSAASQF